MLVRVEMVGRPEPECRGERGSLSGGKIEAYLSDSNVYQWLTKW